MRCILRRSSKLTNSKGTSDIQTTKVRQGINSRDNIKCTLRWREFKETVTVVSQTFLTAAPNKTFEITKMPVSLKKLQLSPFPNQAVYQDFVSDLH